MNKRIEELAEQAWNATAVSPEFGHPTSFAEKFAELIVRECIEVSQVGSITEDKLKKHFGVEE